MRVEDEEIHLRSINPMVARVGGVDFEGQKAVRVTITVRPRKGQTVDDLDLTTASFIHAQELFGVLRDLVTTIREGDPAIQDVLEEVGILIKNIREYW